MHRHWKTRDRRSRLAIRLHCWRCFWCTFNVVLRSAWIQIWRRFCPQSCDDNLSGAAIKSCLVLLNAFTSQLSSLQCSRKHFARWIENKNENFMNLDVWKPEANFLRRKWIFSRHIAWVVSISASNSFFCQCSFNLFLMQQLPTIYNWHNHDIHSSPISNAICNSIHFISIFTERMFSWHRQELPTTIAVLKVWGGHSRWTRWVLLMLVH